MTTRSGAAVARSQTWKGRAATLTSVLLAALCTACSGAGSAPVSDTGSSQTGSVSSSPPTRRSSPAWLGLNYNSGTGVGTLNEFSRLGIDYDRLGALEVKPGATIANSRRLARGLRASTRAGMIPDVLVDPTDGPHHCESDPQPSKLCLPVTPTQIHHYVSGFVVTARSILRAYPHSGVSFEPLNEPWNWPYPPGTPSGSVAAKQYATLLSALLPAAKRAGIPLRTIYVPATGTLDDGTSWIPDLYAARPCLQPRSGSCGPIEGWNLHPYGLPTGDPRGISMVPAMRSEMVSGQDNIIISEIGFCATDVDGGQDCELNVSEVDGSSAQTAQWLTQTLDAAAQMHEQGSLRALILWVRSGGGWSMQTADGKLTAQGKALVRFAKQQKTGG